MDKSRFFAWTGLFVGIKALWITRAFLVDNIVNRVWTSGKLLFAKKLNL